tara:strand:- start:142 stop:414 length:273 start_codon:yes stop_codon:yes gene_type:complete
VNKNELVATVANSTGLSKSQSAEAIEAVIDTITAQLRSGSDVRLVGFGTFSISRRQATTGRNPRTGETINIAASNVPKFKAGKALKDGVN